MHQKLINFSLLLNTPNKAYWRKQQETRAVLIDPFGGTSEIVYVTGEDHFDTVLRILSMHECFEYIGD